jgi:PleD family two-component response regulator
MAAKQLIQDRLEQLERLLAERADELGRVHAELQRTPTTDELTGLANVSRFLDFLALEWRRARREQFELSVLRIGIDHFGAFVERSGESVANDCVRQIATALTPIIRRPGDLLARYLGADFVAVLSCSRERRSRGRCTSPDGSRRPWSARRFPIRRLPRLSASA